MAKRRRAAVACAPVSRSCAGGELRSEYCGWHPPAEGDAALGAQGLTAEGFWRAHIACRRPAVIRELLPDLHPALRWTDEHLLSCAGAARVSVEQRSSASEGFGQGRKVQMAFGEFVRRVAAGEELLYLSTQQAAVGADGHAEVVASPLAELCAAGGLPQQPALMGHLVPQQLNLWMGAAQQGASSGLHHDFHDNLYVLLRGRKRLRLYPPSAVAAMYTHGRPRLVHRNGRIVYAGQGDVNADGSGAADVAAWRQRQDVEAAAAACAQPGAADVALDAALDAALDSVAGRGAGDGGSEEDWDAADDYQDSDDRSSSPEAACGSGRDGPPPSFSRIDLALPPVQLTRRFPRFPGTAAALEVNLRAGEALYLPAGWFHEVTSFSVGAAPHMALNYWFHPPDNLDPGPGGFASPYVSGFWPSAWAARRARGSASQVAGTAGGAAGAAEGGRTVPEPAARDEQSAPAGTRRRTRSGGTSVAAGSFRRRHLALLSRHDVRGPSNLASCSFRRSHWAMERKPVKRRLQR